MAGFSAKLSAECASVRKGRDCPVETASKRVDRVPSPKSGGDEEGSGSARANPLVRRRRTPGCAARITHNDVMYLVELALFEVLLEHFCPLAAKLCVVRHDISELCTCVLLAVQLCHLFIPNKRRPSSGVGAPSPPTPVSANRLPYTYFCEVLGMPRSAGKSSGRWEAGPATKAAIARGEEVAIIGGAVPAAYLPSKPIEVHLLRANAIKVTAFCLSEGVEESLKSPGQE